MKKEKSKVSMVLRLLEKGLGVRGLGCGRGEGSRGLRGLSVAVD